VMRQAIVTKYLGPTDHKGSRVKAYCDAGIITIPWDDGLNPDENHLKAATCLAWKFGWLDNQKLIGGAMPHHGNPFAYCFVLASKGTRS
jgi:hypothetical protein